ncbi:MAG: hypothetical protein EBZ91_13675 [Gammaproteobacteria bacterium]|nr:hypothetical protein [Gammaproteobacteria bacterium]
MIPLRWISLCAALALTACGGGSGGAGGGAPTVNAAGGAGRVCDGSCASANSALTIAQVETVIARAVVEAQARNARATIAVVDRVGNVLAVYAMNGAAPTVTVRSTQGAVRIDGGLENVSVVPATLGAIAKAVTGASTVRSARRSDSLRTPVVFRCISMAPRSAASA